MPSTTTAPELVQLTSRVDIQAAASEGKRPTFSIVAYTGGSMSVSGFYYPVVIELSGLKLPPQIPIFRSHDPDRLVGQGTPKLEGGQVTISGTITSDGPDAAEVVSNAKNGFNWQASVGASAERQEMLEAGKTATVNGRQVTGPLYIVRASTLKETSFVPIGADGATSATVAAKKKGAGTMADEPNDQVQGGAATAKTPAEIQAEYKRVQDLYAVGATHRLEDSEIQAAVQAGESVGEFKARLFDLMNLRASRPNNLGPGILGDGGPPVRDAIEAGLMIRAGNEALAIRAYGERAAEAGRRLRLTNNVDTIRALLRADGRDPSGMGRDELIRAGFSTLSIPTTLSNVMGKSLLPAYLEQTASWRGFAAIRSAADFKAQTAIRPSAVQNLSPLPPGGEIAHGTLGESTFDWQIGSYAKMFTIDRQVMINDDLGFLTETPRLLATAAARTLNDLVWTPLIANTGSFFSVGNANLTTAALSITSFGAAMAAVRNQRDGSSNDISIVPRVLAVAPYNEATARALQTSVAVGRTDGEPSGNPWTAVVDVVVESRISNTAKFTGADADDWFIFGPPESAPIIVGFLDGMQFPTIESFGLDSNPNVLAFSFRCYHDFGVALGDPKAAHKADIA